MIIFKLNFISVLNLQVRFNFDCAFGVGEYVTLTGRLCVSNNDMYLYVRKSADISIGLSTDKSICASKILCSVQNAIGQTDQNLSVLHLEKYV